MRIAEFSRPGDLDPVALAAAVFFDLAEGADPGELVRFIVGEVELPPAEAQDIVGQENAKLQELMLHVAERLERNASPRDIADNLVDRDWPRVLATAFVDRMQRELRVLGGTSAGREQLLAAARRRMTHGLLWFGGGILLTWFTQYAAEQTGGRYSLITWGAILYGFALVAMGAYRWVRHRFQACGE